MLARLLDLVERLDDPVEFMRAAKDSYARTVGTAGVDQVRAAGTEAKAVLDELAARLADAAPASGEVTPSVLAHLLAAHLRCLAGHACLHARRFDPRPTRVFLGARVASCQECVRRFAGPLRAYERVIEADHECDLCLSDGHTTFYPVLLGLGPLVFIGDTCSACHRILCPDPACTT